MTDENQPGGSLIRRLPYLVVVLCLLWFSIFTLHSSIFRFFNADEFRYAHAAWLFANGQLPYIDFWDHKFPFLYQLLSVFFLISGDDPLVMWSLRVAMALFSFVSAMAIYRINRNLDGRWALLAPVCLLSITSYTFVGIEIQPDGAATAFFIAAVAILYVDDFRKVVRGFLAGVLVMLAVWTSQKALFYGSIFFMAIVVDIVVNLRKKGPYLLGSPVACVFGGCAVVAAVALYLFLTGSTDEWYRWTIGFSLLEYDENYPQISRFFTLRPLLIDAWALFLFSGVGIAVTVARLRRAGQRWSADPDLLSISALVMCFLVWFVQKGAWPYSLLPFMTVLAVFAARGIVASFRWMLAQDLSEGRWTLKALSPLLLIALHLFPSVSRSTLPHLPRNQQQLSNLEAIMLMTNERDAIYDNSGSYVARPHAYSPYFTNFLMRMEGSYFGSKLVREVPNSIVEKQCSVLIVGTRLGEVPRPLRRWLMSHFLPAKGSIYLWGKRFQPVTGEELNTEFHAVRDGQYYLRPAKAFSKLSLTIDDVRITSPIFHLERGKRQVKIESTNDVKLEILWLPRDGRRYSGNSGFGPNRMPHSIVHYNFPRL